MLSAGSVVYVAGKMQPAAMVVLTGAGPCVALMLDRGILRGFASVISILRVGTRLQGGHSSEVLVAQPSRRIHEAAPSLPRLATVIDV